ncbi:MAG TPA: Ig-like domain-containing protein, partial [Thermoanaerobaculia bacterium]|nr:Ig-like domain-containing protein [Thermoanaerobaculia bacterium]
VVGRANYGRARAGVATRFPGFPDSALPGWGFELDTSRFLNGHHNVTVRIRSKAGEVVHLSPRRFQFLNVEHNLRPFGKIEFPRPQAEMRGNCDLFSPNRRYSVVSGYALDVGVTEEDSGIAFVELMIDRAVVYNSDVSCQFDNLLGGQTNCYGVRRVDVERIFPGLKDSSHSGFRFVLDVGALVTSLPPAEPPFLQGHHVLTVRAGDHANQVTNIAELPVTFSCDDNIPNENSFGDIDLPRPGLLYNGNITVTGWALDWEGVNNVQVLVDGKAAGNAVLGIGRNEVLSQYPGFPESLASGWQFTLNTRNYENGEHFIAVIVPDDLGVTTFIGRRRIVINNV